MALTSASSEKTMASGSGDGRSSRSSFESSMIRAGIETIRVSMDLEP